MKRVFTLAIFITAALTYISAHAEDFAIEDPGLTPVLVQATTAIRKALKGIDDGRGKLCEFIGKPVDLDGDGKPSDLVVTRKDACAWGAALGPIIVLKKTGDAFAVVLEAGGYSLTIGKEKQHGLRHIVTSSGTAGLYEERLWKYDGRKYVKAREYVGPPR